MQLKIWAKTLFSIYSCLPRLAKSLDMLVDVRASSCFHKNISGITLCSTTKVTDDITALINKKISLINIRCLIDKVIRALPEKSAEFLKLKYFEGRTFEEVSALLGVSIRTVMRWNIGVIERSAFLMEKFGFGEEAMTDLIDNQIWILKIKNKIELEEDQSHSSRIIEFVLFNQAQKEYRKFLI